MAEVSGCLVVDEGICGAVGVETKWCLAVW